MREEELYQSVVSSFALIEFVDTWQRACVCAPPQLKA